jgi:agmatinase
MQPDASWPTFLGLDEPPDQYERSRIVVLPLPYERTTSYGSGTAGGPLALLHASTQVETWDEDLDLEPCAAGVATLPPCSPSSPDPEVALREIEGVARRHLLRGKLLLSLGGEHALTPALVRAVHGVLSEPFGVVQFDAHADLRDEYQGSAASHACAMRRILDLGLPTLGVGIRSLSAPEASLLHERRLPVIWGRDLDRAEELFDRYLAGLPQTIYLTFDVDYFDPSLVPATGTPEPGGGRWYPTLRLLRRLFASKRVVAADIVELAPIAGLPTSDFVAARLAYKLVGLWSRSAESAPPG